MNITNADVLYDATQCSNAVEINSAKTNNVFHSTLGCLGLCMGVPLTASAQIYTRNCLKCKEIVYLRVRSRLLLKGEEKKSDTKVTHSSSLTEDKEEKLKESYIPFNTEQNAKWTIKTILT